MALAEAVEGDAVEQDAKEAGGEDGHEEGEPEGPGRAGYEPPGDHGAHHEDGGVGQVEDVEHTEHEGVAQRKQGIYAACKYAL